MYQSNELYHHGIKGQRWGVRRYQNEDGTLTPAGKKRYGSEEFYNDVQSVRKNGFQADYTVNSSTKEMEITQFYTAEGKKMGQEYAAKVLAQANKDSRQAAAIQSAKAIAAGTAFVAAYSYLAYKAS